MASELLRTQLPQPWNFGVTRDGRVFFINEESRSTTWLHPVYNHPVQSGNLSRQDLPKGWEQSFTPEGVPYYIDHTSLRTSFIHPITGQSALPVHDNNQGPGQNNQKQDHFKRASLRRKSNKQKVIDKLPVAKRSENSPVTHQGWLYKQDSGGLKGWKRRWFVLSDFCLFYYKSQLDTQTQGSVLLPSYKIDYCSREDGVNKKFSFKAEHQNMRTYYFAAESKQEQDAWMSCLSSATVLQQRAASGPEPDQVFPEDQDHGGFQVNPPAPYNTADNRISGGDPRGDPRFDPRADPRSNSGGPGQGYEPGNDTGGFGDSETPRYLPNEQNNPQGYDPRMNANPQMQPVMRNSYERPRSVPPVENRYSGQEWGNPRESDPRFDPRFRDSYRGGDQDSLSSRGSNNMRPNRDYNYNVPEDRKPGPSYLGVASNGYNPQQDSSTLEQSNDDSMEKTLDRSFDSTQPIPGYDSFQQQRSLTGQYQVQDPQPGQYQMQDPQPGQYQARDSQQRPLSGQYQIQDPHPGQYQSQNPQQRPLSGQYQVQNPQQRPLSGQYQVQEPELNRSVPSRETSMSDMGRSDSLRHLQEWKNQQMRNPQRTPSGSTSPRDQPISDGRRQYTSSASSPRDGSSERSSSRNMPPAQSSLPRQGTTHRSPPPDPLKLDGFQQSGSSGSPDPAPNRPPIPAAYREQYIRELAETKTPHSRNDLLSSIDIQRQRQEEPLVFRYPEDERRQKAVPPRKEFVGEDTYDSRRADTNLQPPRIDPSKSWDDLNSLDAEDAQERFRYDSRIDLLMAEKKRIAGPITEPNRMAPVLEQKPKQWQEPKPAVDRQVFNQDQRQLPRNPYQSQTSYSSVFGQEVERRDMVDARRNFMPGEADSNRSDSFRIMPAEDPNKSVRRSLESDFMNKGRQHQNEPPSNPRTNQQNDIYAVPKPRNMSQTPASRNSWQDAADHHGMGFPPYGPPSSVTQSYRDVRRVKQAPVSSTPRSPTEGFREQEDRLSRSLGNLHVDVGDWSPNPAGYPNQYPEKRGGDARGHEVPLLGRLSSSEGQLLDDHSQPLDNRPASQGPLAGRGSPKPMQNSGAPRYASPGPQPGPPKPGRGRNIETIKEDPNMSDQDILTTKTLAELEQHLSGHRMRLSIAATDLVGKTHEELVLLLIQLRRDQSKLERTKDFYRSKLDVGRPQEKDYKLKRKNSIGRLHEVVEREHDVYAELRKMYDELENQLEVTKPLVNLLDNMVRMGSLYGGDNMMLASQYKRHKILPEQYTPPKKMILFSRQHQEEKLSKEQEEELKQLMEDEVDLEEKLQQLYQLDRELQERSLAATNLQQSKDLLEKSVTQLRKDLLSTEDPRNLQRMKHQLRLLEAELLTVRQQLAETSRLLEETSAEDAKVENEVILLRKKIYGIGRSQSSPTMGNENIRARQQLEQELHGVQSVMEGLSKQGAALSDTIKALRHSTPDLTSSGAEKNNKTYLETDMDSGRSRDLAKEPSQGANPYTSVTHQSQVTKTERIQKTSEMYSRDRSKSEPPKVEEKIQQQSMPYTYQQRDASMVSQHAPINSGSAANQWGPSQNGQGPGSDRNSLGSSQRRFEPGAGSNQSWGSSQERIGSARDPRGPSPHGSITRDQLPLGAENRGNQQYQQRVVEVQRSYQIQNGANSPSSSSSLDQQPNTYRPTGAPQTSQAHQEGVYHAEMRMVTPEPRDQYRYDYRGPRPRDLGSPSDSHNQEYDQRSASQQEKTFIKKHPDLAYSGKPTSEVKPQQQYRVQHVSMSSDMKTKDMEEANSYTPMELSEAEDNMKKFYGLIPKDAARTQTVRDVKKKENERRSRERKRFYVNVHGPADMEEAEEFDNNYGFQRSQSLPRRVSAPVYAAKKQSQDDSMSKRKSVGVYQAKKSVAESRASASERLFPKVSPSVSTEPQPGRIKSQEHVRRISDIFTPRPFGGSSNSGGSPWKRDDESKFGSSTSKLTSSATVATVRPVVNTNRGVDMTVTHAISTGSKSYTSNTAPSSTNGEVEIIRENARGKKYWEERLKQRHTPRGRFMTISSAQPTELEKEHVWKPSKLSSAAGDLISGRWLAGRNNYIQGEPLKALKFDELTIDREVLYVPDKVDIPERYIASDDEETEEEKQHRSDKGEQIKRMLAAQSLAEWKQEEVGMNRRGDSGLLHAHVQAERQRREQLLDLKQALAREVTQKSKQVAGMNQQQYSRGNEGPGRGQSAGGSLSPTYTSHTVIGSLSPPPDERGMMGYSSSRRIRTISR